MKILCFLFLLIFPIVLISQTSDDEVQKIGEKEFPFMMRQIPAGKETFFGFKNHEDLTFTKPGRPYCLYTLYTDKLKSASVNPDECIIQIEEWKIPVVYRDGEIRTFFTLKKIKGELLPTSLTGAELAKELNAFKPEMAPNISKKGIIRTSDNKSEFLLLVEKDKTIAQGKFYPLKSAKTQNPAFEKMKKEYLSFKELKNIFNPKKTKELIKKKK